MYIYDIPDEVISSISMNADDTILYFRCGWSSDLCSQPVLAFELESNVRKLVNWYWKKLVGFNAGKAQLIIPFNSLKSCNTLNVKMDGPVCWDCPSLLNQIGASILAILRKLPPQENWSLDFSEVSFFF